MHKKQHGRIMRITAVMGVKVSQLCTEKERIEKKSHTLWTRCFELSEFTVKNERNR